MRFLFDLENDPYELKDQSKNSKYRTIKSHLLARLEEFRNKTTDPEIPSKYSTATAWKKCGGICPWLTNDPTFEPISVGQVYNNENPPNIIFILVDDWGYNDIGSKSTYLKWTTPTIDRLASEGIKLENYFTHYSCIPSRGAFLTGRYPIRLGLWVSRESAELPLTESTIAQEMQSAGYITYIVGKWHMGYSTSNHLPSNRGFHYYYGYLNGFTDYWTKKYGAHLDLHENFNLVTNAAETSSSLHNGYLLEQKAEEAIVSHKLNHPNKPMFLYYAMQLIHGYWSAPDEFLSRCSKPTEASISSGYKRLVEHNYCALNVMLDEAVANLTCALEANNMIDNTIMVLVSDNGGEDTVTGNNYPFKGAKGQGWRGGISANGFIHSRLIPDSMKGSSYNGLMHVTGKLSISSTS